MALSDMAVRKVKSTGKAYTLGDIDGLSLAVTAQGGRTWHFRYCWAGKQKRMSLGTSTIWPIPLDMLIATRSPGWTPCAASAPAQQRAW